MFIFFNFKTDSGSSSEIFSSFIEAMDNRNVDLSILTYMGLNGTTVNTNYVRGVIRLTELHLPRFCS